MKFLESILDLEWFKYLCWERDSNGQSLHVVTWPVLHDWWSLFCASGGDLKDPPVWMKWPWVTDSEAGQIHYFTTYYVFSGKNPDSLSWDNRWLCFRYYVSFLLVIAVQSKSCPTLQPHELQHARLPCPSLSPGVFSNSCSLSQWFHPTISSSVVPFSSFPQSFPVSGSFPVSQLFTSHGWSFGASASVLPINIQGWFPLGLAGLIFLLFKGLSRVFSITTVRKHQFFGAQSCLWSNSHVHTWLLEKPRCCCCCPTLCDPIDGSPPGSPIPGILQTIRIFVGKVMSLLFNILSRFVIAFFQGANIF